MKISCRIRRTIIGLTGTILSMLLLSACGTAAPTRVTAEAGLLLLVRVQAGRQELLRASVAPGDRLVFTWRHSVEHFSWLECFDIDSDGSLILREMRVQGYGAGIPHARGQQHKTTDGWIISSGIDELQPAYLWINSHSAVSSVELNGKLLFAGSDFPHHEALELRVEPWRTP